MEIRLSLLKKNMKAETIIDWMNKYIPTSSFFSKIKRTPLEFNTFIRLLFVARWSVMVCRKQHFQDYYNKYGFFFLRLILRKLMTDTYTSKEMDDEITKTLESWVNVAHIGEADQIHYKNLGALKIRKKKKSTKKRKPKRKRKYKRRPCKTIRECKKKLTGVKKRIKNLTRKKKKKRSKK